MARNAYLSSALAALCCCVLLAAGAAALDVTLFVSDVDPATNSFEITADGSVDITAFQFEVVDQNLNTLDVADVTSPFNFNIMSNNQIVVGFSTSGIVVPAGQNVSFLTVTLQNPIGNNDVCINNIVVSDASPQGQSEVVALCGGSEVLNGDVQLFIDPIDADGRANVSFISTAVITTFQFNLIRTDGLQIAVTGVEGGIAGQTFDTVNPLPGQGGVIAFSTDVQNPQSIPPTSTKSVLLTIQTNEAAGLVPCIVSAVFGGDLSQPLDVIETACVPPIDVTLLIDNVGADGGIDVLIESFVAITGFQFDILFSNGDPVLLASASGGLAGSVFGNNLMVSAAQGRVSAMSMNGEQIPAQMTPQLLVTVATTEMQGTSVCLQNSAFTAEGGAQATVQEPQCVLTAPSNITLFVSPVDAATNSFTVTVNTDVAIAGIQFLTVATDNSGNAFPDATIDNAMTTSIADENNDFIFSTAGTNGAEVLLVSLNPDSSAVGPGEGILVTTIFLSTPANAASVCIDSVVLSDAVGNPLGFQIVCGSTGSTTDVTLDITAVSDAQEVVVLISSSVEIISFSLSLTTFNSLPANIVSVQSQGVAQESLNVILAGNTVVGLVSMTSIPPQNNAVFLTLGTNEPANTQICIENLMFVGSMGASLSITSPPCIMAIPSPPPPAPPLPPIQPFANVIVVPTGSEVQFFLNSSVAVGTFTFQVIDLALNQGVPIDSFSTQDSLANMAGFSLTLGSQIGSVAGMAAGGSFIAPSAGTFQLLEINLVDDAPPGLCITDLVILDSSQTLIMDSSVSCPALSSPGSPMGFNSPPVSVEFLVPFFNGQTVEVRIRNEVPVSDFILAFDSSSVFTTIQATQATWQVVGGLAQQLGYTFSPMGPAPTLATPLVGTPPNATVEYPSSNMNGTIMLEIAITDPSNQLSAGDELCLSSASVNSASGPSVNAIITCGDDIPPPLDPLVEVTLQQTPGMPQVEIAVANVYPVSKFSLSLAVGGSPLDLSGLSVTATSALSPLALSTTANSLSSGIVAAESGSSATLALSSSFTALITFAQPGGVSLGDIDIIIASFSGPEGEVVPFVIIPAEDVPEGSPPPDEEDGGFGSLGILAISIGGAAVLLIVIIAVIILSRRKKSPKAASRSTNVKHVEMTEDGSGSRRGGDPSEPTGGGPLSVRVAGRG